LSADKLDRTISAVSIRKANTTSSLTIQSSHGWEGSLACTLKMPRMALAGPARYSLNCAVSHSSFSGIECFYLEITDSYRIPTITAAKETSSPTIVATGVIPKTFTIAYKPTARSTYRSARKMPYVRADRTDCGEDAAPPATSASRIQERRL